MFEDRVSIIRIMGLPDTFAVVLLTFSLILAVAPYLSAKDFGLFKVPEFTDSARKKLRVLGPILFVAILVLFVPMVSRQVSTKTNHTTPANTNDNQSDTNIIRTRNDGTPTPSPDPHVLVEQHVRRAKDLYGAATGEEDFKAAVEECNRALALEPGNQDAVSLKSRINKTREILNRNQ
jgi:hypothetical protein